MPAAHGKCILVVDDEDQCRLTLKWYLESLAYGVETAGSAEEALALFDPRVHVLVLTDNSMVAMSGAEMARLIKERSAATSILMYTALPPEDLSNIDLCIEKPASLTTIRDTIHLLLEGKAG